MIVVLKKGVYDTRFRELGYLNIIRRFDMLMKKKFGFFVMVLLVAARSFAITFDDLKAVVDGFRKDEVRILKGDPSAQTLRYVEIRDAYFQTLDDSGYADLTISEKAVFKDNMQNLLDTLADAMKQSREALPRQSPASSPVPPVVVTPQAPVSTSGGLPLQPPLPLDIFTPRPTAVVKPVAAVTATTVVLTWEKTYPVDAARLARLETKGGNDKEMKALQAKKAAYNNASLKK